MSQEYQIVFKTNAEEIIKIMEQMNKLGLQMEKGYNIQFNTSQISSATRQINQMQTAAQRVEKAFSGVSKVLGTAGSGLQNLGNLFGGRVVNTAKTMATAFGTMGLYSAAQGTVERYDIMRMFPKRMARLGFSETQAQEAVDRLEQSVLGLPTGLDEIVNSANQLITLTGSLKKGTDLAIATNNAFLAGGADAQQVEYGQRQIRDLLAAGKLRTQEWDSLFKSLGAGLGVVAEQMGYKGKTGGKIKENNELLDTMQKKLKKLRSDKELWELEGGHTKSALDKKSEQIHNLEVALSKMEDGASKDLGDFRNDLKQGEISAEEFTNALIKAAGIDENGKMGKLAEWTSDIKDTLGAAGKNVKNAVQKLGAAGFMSLDNVLEKGTGKNLVQNIVDISDGIKKSLAPALTGWIDQNSDKIVGFFDKLKGYDWIGLVSKVGKGLAQYYDIMAGFFTKMSPKLVSFLAVWGGPVGRLLQTASGGIETIGRAVGFLIRHFGTAKAVKGVSDVAETVGQIGKVGRSFKTAFQGLGLAAGITGEMALLGGVVAEYAKVIELIGNIKIGSDFGKNMQAVAEFATVMFGASGFMTTIGSLVSYAGGAGFAAVGEALSGGLLLLMEELGRIFDRYAKVVDFIAQMDIPSETRWSELKSVVTNLADLYADIPKIPRSTTNTMESMSDIMDSVVDIAKDLKKVREVGQIGDMSSRMEGIVNAALAIEDAVPKNVDKKLGKKMKNLASATKSAGEVADALQTMKSKMTYLSTHGQNGKRRYENLADQLNGLFGGRGLQKVFTQFDDNYKRYKTSSANMSAAVGSLGTMIDTLMTAKDNIKKLTTFSDKTGKWRSVTAKRLSALLSGTLAVFEDKQLNLRTKEKAIGMQNLERISSMTSSLATVAESLVKSQGNVKALTHMGHAGRGGWQMDANMFDQLTAIVRSVVGWVKGLNEIPGFDEIDAKGGIAEKLTAFSGIVSELPALLDGLKGLKFKGLFKDGEFKKGNKLAQIIGSLQGVFTGLATADFVDLSANAESLKKAIDYTVDIITALHGINAVISGLMGEDGTFTLGSKLAGIFGSLNYAFGLVGPSLNGSGGVGTLGTVAPQLQEIATQLGAIGTNGESAASGLQGAAEGANALGGAAKTHNGNIKTLATNVGNLKSALSGIFGLGFTAAAGVNAVGEAAGQQVNHLSSAAGAAARLAAAIESIPTNKTVNISVNGSGSSGSSGSSGNSLLDRPNIMRAHGGPVYGPGGIDNVRAWLTNGEFVMRRRAHSKFGTAFMNRINNLDVEGAMRALSLRAGTGVFRTASVTNNYTRDNHSNVTFNVQRATQGFAQRRANRWARSLS